MKIPIEVMTTVWRPPRRITFEKQRLGRAKTPRLQKTAPEQLSSNRRRRYKQRRCGPTRILSELYPTWRPKPTSCSAAKSALLLRSTSREVAINLGHRTAFYEPGSLSTDS